MNKSFIVEVICSPKKIKYYAEDEEDAKAQFLEENPAFNENDLGDVWGIVDRGSKAQEVRK